MLYFAVKVKATIPCMLVPKGFQSGWGQVIHNFLKSRNNRASAWCTTRCQVTEIVKEMAFFFFFLFMCVCALAALTASMKPDKDNLRSSILTCAKCVYGNLCSNHFSDSLQNLAL